MLTKRVSSTGLTREWPRGINDMPIVSRQDSVSGERQKRKLVLFLILLVALPAGSLHGLNSMERSDLSRRCCVKINILNRMMVAVVLSVAWLVGMSIPANAQEQGQQEHQQKQGKEQQKKERPQHPQKQEKKQTKGQMQARQQKQRGQNKQQQQTAQQQQRGQQRTRAVANNRGNNGNHGNGNNGNHYGRISDARYRAHFGHDHSFRMSRPRMVDGYNRFQYSGYSFGFNQPWPVGWSYNDNVYVEYVRGGYYLCNPRYPGIQITLNIF